MNRTMSLIRSAVLLCLFIAGCKGTQADPQADSGVDTVRAEVAKILGKNAGDIDVTKPLSASGADELDVVEIVLAVEKQFNVSIPDSALGEKPSQTLTVQQLAEIAAKQPKGK